MTGDELRRCRRVLGLTQAGLAARLGVAANTVHRWERGSLRMEHPEMIAAVLSDLERERGAISTAPAAPLD